MALFCAGAMADAAGDLQQRVGALPHFQAEFQQVVVDQEGQTLQQGEGSLAVATPDQFRWHQVQPEESLILSDGQVVYVYDPLLEQVSLYGVDQALVQSPLSLLSDLDPEAWEQYQISQQGDCYRLEPKEAQGIQAMSLCFQQDTISTLALEDSQGLTTTMTLTQFSQAEPDNATFTFEPPEGTLIDDQRSQ